MTRRCRLCHRPLRDPLWRARGVGRHCARRAGLVASRRCRAVLVRSARPAEVGEGQLALFDVEDDLHHWVTDQAERLDLPAVTGGA